MELIGIFLPLAVWIPIFVAAAVVVYIGHVLVIQLVIGPTVGYFFGRDARWDFEDVATTPAEVIWNIGNGIRAFLAIPWRLHRKTVFERVFDFRPHGLFHQTEWDQERVDEKLQKLAFSFKGACDAQEVARSKDLAPTARLRLDGQVKEAKKAFWSAHNSAEHLGFKVRYDYKEYLPEEQRAAA